MGFFLVMKAEVVRSLIIQRRYWFASLTGLIIGYVMFMGLIFGFMHGTVDVAWAQKATNGVFSLLIGAFAFGIVGLFSQGLQSMAQSGELEQVYMSPHGLITNFLARSFVASVVGIVMWTIVLTMISATLKTKLHADLVPTTALLFLTYVNLIGFGFMVGGMVLVFKQTGQVAMLFRLAFFLIALGSDTLHNMPMLWKFIHIIPITDATYCLKLVVINGVGMHIFAERSFYALMINCVIWTAIGISCFKYMENWSRDKGTLGVY